MSTLIPAHVLRYRLVGLLVLSSLFCAVLIVTRVLITQRLGYIFLGWNLALAWMPLLLAEGFRRLAGRWGGLRLVVFAIWLAFLPNAPYLLTDLLHLKPQGSGPFWLDWLTLLSCGWTGLLLFMLAIRRMEFHLHSFWQTHPHPLFQLLRHLFIPVVLFLSAFGVSLGRFARTNSWEIITNPFGVIGDVLHVLNSPRAFGISLLFGVFLLLVWYSISALQAPTFSAHSIPTDDRKR